MEAWLKRILKSFKLHEPVISAVLGGLVLVLVLVMVVVYFRATQPEPQITESAAVIELGNVPLVQVETGEFVPQDLPEEHVVEAGEHLWEISVLYYGSGFNWIDIAEANGLTEPYVLTEGMRLKLPMVPVRALELVQTLAGETDDSISEKTTYVVQPGDDLWAIAVRTYGDGFRWVEVYEANQGLLSNPDGIEVGMELVLPR